MQRKREVKPIHRRFLLLGVTVFLVLLLAVWIAKTPMHPVAYVRVLSETGTPVAGALVLPEGLRTKPGPYVSGWYDWRIQENGGVPNPPATPRGDSVRNGRPVGPQSLNPLGGCDRSGARLVGKRR